MPTIHPSTRSYGNPKVLDSAVIAGSCTLTAVKGSLIVRDRARVSHSTLITDQGYSVTVEGDSVVHRSTLRFNVIVSGTSDCCEVTAREANFLNCTVKNGYINDAILRNSTLIDTRINNSYVDRSLVADVNMDNCSIIGSEIQGARIWECTLRNLHQDLSGSLLLRNIYWWKDIP